LHAYNNVACGVYSKDFKDRNFVMVTSWG